MKPVRLRHLAQGVLLGLVVSLIGCEGKVSKTKTPESASASTAPKSDIETKSVDESMLTVQQEPFGQNEAGQEITAFTLQNKHGMKVGLINLGGIITSVDVPDKSRQFANVTLGFPTAAEYLVNAPYFGGICGRYANRIANGKFSLDGNNYELFVNGQHHLHGGKSHFMQKIWTAEPFQTDKAAGVALTYVSPDNEEGYPGKLKTVVKYSLNDDNELTIEYEATTDKPTVLNLTNHAYWNLSGEPGSLILDHKLKLFCDKYLVVDEGSIPTEIAPVAGTVMDFTKPEPIGTRIDQPVNGNGGYDHCYVINGKSGDLRPTAKVVDPKSGRVMEISSTEPAVQFYTGNHLKGTPETGNAPKHGALCLETQHYPDSPNHPDFPTTRLNPGETYRQTTVLKFSVEK